MEYVIRTTRNTPDPGRSALFLQELLSAAMHDEGLTVEPAEAVVPDEERRSVLAVLAGSPIVIADLWSRYSRKGRISPVETQRLMAMLANLRQAIGELHDPPEFAPMVLFIEKSINELGEASSG